MARTKNTSKAKKLTRGSDSISVNYGNTFANYYNAFAYFCVTRNTFWATLNDQAAQKNVQTLRESEVPQLHNLDW